jgi:purine nucleosidase
LDKRQIVLDVDVGIDDALMMLYLAADPRAEIVAVGSTHGNCSSAQAALNALKVLDVCELDHVPVATGAESPLPNATYSPHVHGHDGLADVGIPASKRTVTGESAVDQLVRLSAERPGELDLIAVGAMTNLALALEQDSESLKRFRSVTILGGVSGEPPREPHELYDANVFHSPDAAETLLASGTYLTVCPIDLSYLAVLEDDHLEAIKSSSTAMGKFAWQILPFYCDFYEPRIGRWSASMHDPIAAGIFLDESFITRSVERPMAVEPYLDRYRAIGRDSLTDRAPVRIAVEADVPRFLDEFVARITT